MNMPILLIEKGKVYMKKIVSLLFVLLISISTILFTSNTEVKAGPAPALTDVVIDSISNIDGNWDYIPHKSQPLYKTNRIMQDNVYLSVTIKGYANIYFYSDGVVIPSSQVTRYKSVPTTVNTIVTGWTYYYRIPVASLNENNLRVFATSQVGPAQLWSNIVSFDVATVE